MKFIYKLISVLALVFVVILITNIIFKTQNNKPIIKGELFLCKYGNNSPILSINTDYPDKQFVIYDKIKGYDISVTKDNETIYYREPFKNSLDSQWHDCLYKYDKKTEVSTAIYTADNINLFNNRNNYIYVLKGNTLVSYELTTQEEDVLFENVKDFDIGENFICFTDIQDNIYLYNIIAGITHEIKFSYQDNSVIYKIRISKNDNYVGYDDGSRIYVMDLINNIESVIEPQQGYNSWIFSPDSKFIAVCERQPYFSINVVDPQRIVLWSVIDNKESTLIDNLQYVELADWK